MNKSFSIYSDGSCLKNPGGPGGWAYVIIDDNHSIINKDYGSDKQTTNNKMELMGIIKALEYIINNDSIFSRKTNNFIMYVDSKYVCDGIKSWIKKWRMNGWVTSTKKPVLNEELWRQLDEYNNEIPNKQWNWVKAHAGNKYNEIVDKLALSAAKNAEKTTFI